MTEPKEIVVHWAEQVYLPTSECMFLRAETCFEHVIEKGTNTIHFQQPASLKRRNEHEHPESGSQPDRPERTNKGHKQPRLEDQKQRSQADRRPQQLDDLSQFLHQSSTTFSTSAGHSVQPQNPGVSSHSTIDNDDNDSDL